jgi:N-methylhydantoinase A
MQFRGQTHLIRVSIPSADISRAELQLLFEEAYFRRFQVRLPEVRAVLINLVTSVIGRRPSPSIGALCESGTGSAATLPARSLYVDGAWQEAQVFARSALRPHQKINGPAIIQQLDATTVIEPGASATLDAIGNLRIKVRA